MGGWATDTLDQLGMSISSTRDRCRVWRLRRIPSISMYIRSRPTQRPVCINQTDPGAPEKDYLHRPGGNGQSILKLSGVRDFSEPTSPASVIQSSEHLSMNLCVELVFA